MFGLEAGIPKLSERFAAGGLQDQSAARRKDSLERQPGYRRTLNLGFSAVIARLLNPNCLLFRDLLDGLSHSSLVRFLHAQESVNSRGAPPRQAFDSISPA